MASTLRLPSLLAVTFALTTSQGASAMTIVFEFPKAVRSSAVVALVEIERGEVVATPDGQFCGARYVARVVKPIKGAATGQRIEFGRYTEQAIGGQYFVFLDETADGPRNGAPTNDCAASLPRHVVTAEGVGAIHVQAGNQVSYKPAVSFNGMPYMIPKALVGTRKHTGQILDGVLYGSVQIEATAFLDYLRSLAGTCDKQPATGLDDPCL